MWTRWVRGIAHRTPQGLQAYKDTPVATKRPWDECNFDLWNMFTSCFDMSRPFTRLTGCFRMLQSLNWEDWENLDVSWYFMMFLSLILFWYQNNSNHCSSSVLTCSIMCYHLTSSDIMRRCLRSHLHTTSEACEGNPDVAVSSKIAKFEVNLRCI